MCCRGMLGLPIAVSAPAVTTCCVLPMMHRRWPRTVICSATSPTLAGQILLPGLKNCTMYIMEKKPYILLTRLSAGSPWCLRWP